MKRFTFGRCPECEFVVPLERDGTVARHYRRFHTHAHQIVKQLCLGHGFECAGKPISVAATTERRARQIAEAESSAVVPGHVVNARRVVIITPAGAPEVSFLTEDHPAVRGKSQAELVDGAEPGTRAVLCEGPEQLAHELRSGPMKVRLAAARAAFALASGEERHEAVHQLAKVAASVAGGRPRRALSDPEAAERAYRSARARGMTVKGALMEAATAGRYTSQSYLYELRKSRRWDSPR